MSPKQTVILSTHVNTGDKSEYRFNHNHPPVFDNLPELIDTTPIEFQSTELLGNSTETDN